MTFLCCSPSLPNACQWPQVGQEESGYRGQHPIGFAELHLSGALILLHLWKKLQAKRVLLCTELFFFRKKWHGTVKLLLASAVYLFSEFFLLQKCAETFHWTPTLLHRNFPEKLPKQILLWQDDIRKPLVHRLVKSHWVHSWTQPLPKLVQNTALGWLSIICCVYVNLTDSIRPLLFPQVTQLTLVLAKLSMTDSVCCYKDWVFDSFCCLQMGHLVE